MAIILAYLFSWFCVGIFLVLFFKWMDETFWKLSLAIWLSGSVKPIKNEFGFTKQDIDNRIKFAAKLKEEGVTRKNVRQYPQLKVYEPYLPEEKHQDVITKEIEDLIRKERYGIFVDLLLKKKLIS